MRVWSTAGFFVLTLACSVETTTSFDADASAAGSGGSAGGSGGFPPGVENCENGSDDDSDGKVDCADDDCASYVCASIPAGWEGPVALYFGPEAPPECAAAGAFSEPRTDGGTLDVQPYTCPACACDPATASCTPTVISYTMANCGGQQLALTGVGCLGFDSSSDQFSFRLQFNGPAGACSPSSGPTNIPPPTYPEKARVCGLPASFTKGGGCDPDGCVPKPTLPFSLCVHRPDPAPCPEGYPTAHTIVTAFQDTRGCSPCDCPTSCAATAVAWDFCGDTDGPIGSANQPNQCVNLAETQQNLDVDMKGSVQCAPSGGQPAGEVTRTELTLCCAS